MGVGLYLTGRYGGRTAKLTPRKWLDRVEKWLRKNGGEFLASTRHGKSTAGKTALFVGLHPAAEDVEIIAPAVEALRAQGITASGPTPADSLFHEAARARFDAAVCMYHDQALIPVKMLAFWGGVNVTLGLPIVRTSPDHGTAFDIAGRGLARPDSLIAAIRMAAEIAAHRAA